MYTSICCGYIVSLSVIKFRRKQVFCVFVCLFDNKSPQITTWSTYEALCKTGPYSQRSHNWVTRFKSRLYFDIAITSSVFKLEHRSKAQNVRDASGYLDNIVNYQ